MEQEKTSSWFGAALGTAILITLPFALLAWLLVQTTLGHVERYTQMERVLATFRAGLVVIVPLESMRDLAPANTYLDAPEVSSRYEQARFDVDRHLQAFIANLQRFDNNSLRARADHLQQVWQDLGVASETSDTAVPFNNVERLNDEVHTAMASLFFITDLAAGTDINANELLMLVLDTMHKARHDLGLLRAIAIYSRLRDGYLSSSDAEYLDNAWAALDTLTITLEHQLSGIAERHRGDGLPRPEALSPLRTYLTSTEQSLVLAPQLTIGWEQSWHEGETAYAALRSTSDALVDSAESLVRRERSKQLRVDIATAVGLLLLYAAITALGVMFYRTRYAELSARAENRAKSLFLARMSHEIRTPLNGVLGLAELLGDTQPTPRQREYIELISSAGKSLLSLINDILDHAKIEAGKLEISQIPIDIRALICESARVFSLNAGQNRSLIFCTIDDAVPTMMIGDPIRIRQVLLNLIGNAVKFTEQGRIEVYAEHTFDNDGAARLRIEIRDTGIGLTPTEQQSLFNLFTQASPAVTRRFGGTGLGLSISRELVLMMAGNIGVYSSIGDGSVFWFEVPLLPAEDGHPAKLSTLPTLPVPVLLIDADGHLAHAIAALPSAIGQRVSIATNEREARNLLEIHPEIHFVVINGQRWPSDAVALAHHLADHHPKISVRLLTAVGTDIAHIDTPVTRINTSADNLGIGTPICNIVSRSVFTRDDLIALLSPSPSPSLPRIPATENPAATPLHALLPGGLRILVAEDNPVNQLVTRGLLRKLGIDVDVVEDGRCAVNRYAEQSGNYDMVLMDLDMPILDGNAAAREIRGLETASGWSRCPILALSAHATQDYGALALQAGMDGQIVKPVTLATLGDALLQHYLPARQRDLHHKKKSGAHYDI